MADSKKADANKLLIVDDEAPMAVALKNKFTKEGFEVFEAKDGKAGLKIALKEHPDVILLDILMPKMGGLEMLAELRKDKWGAKVPVFLLTNLSDMEKITEAVKLGIEGYLVKSDWKLDEIVRKVRKVLGEKV